MQSAIYLATDQADFVFGPWMLMIALTKNAESSLTCRGQKVVGDGSDLQND